MQNWNIASFWVKSRLTLGDFKTLQVGDLLDLRKFDLARVLVDDIPLFEAEVGTANGYTAARLLQSGRAGRKSTMTCWWSVRSDS